MGFNQGEGDNNIFRSTSRQLRKNIFESVAVKNHSVILCSFMQHIHVCYAHVHLNFSVTYVPDCKS